MPGPRTNLRDLEAEASKDVSLVLGWRSKVFVMPFP